MKFCKYFYLLIFILSVFISKLYAQANELYSKVIYNSIIPEKILYSKGFLYMASYTPTGSGTLITKLTPDGDTVWTYSYYKLTSANFSTMTVDTSGFIYVAGSVTGFTPNTHYIYLLKLDPTTGDSIWTGRYDGIAPSQNYDYATSITVNNSGEVYIVGTSDSSSSNTDIITIKFDSNGDTVWSKRIDYAGYYDYPAELALDTSENIIITGRIAIDNSYTDLIVRKYSPNGNILDEIIYDLSMGYRYNTPNAITLDDQYAYVTGTTERNGSTDIFISKISLNTMDTVWNRFYDGAANGFDYPNDIAVDNSGNIYVTGSINQSGISMDNSLLVLSFDNNGNQKWTKIKSGTENSGGSGDDYGYKITIDLQDNIYIAGMLYNITSKRDIIVLKYNAAGDELWFTEYNSSNNYSNYPRGIELDSNNAIYLLSYDDYNATNSASRLIKYCQDVPNIVLTNDTAICINDSIQLNCSGGNIYLWISGANISDTSIANPIVYPTTKTRYVVRVDKVTGCWDTASVLVGVNSLPNPNFIGAPFSGFAPLEVSFTDQTSPTPVEWLWNFGDITSGSANSSTAQNPSHTYNSGDTFDVSLTVTDVNSCSNTFTRINYIISKWAIVSGRIFKGTPNDTITSGIVYLKDKNAPQINPQTSLIQSDGSYNFNEVSKGEYFLLAKPDIGTFNDVVPTYLGNKVEWYDATFLVLTGNSANNDIVTKEINTGNGQININGRIKEGITGKISGPGDPLGGMDVSLIDKSTNSPLAYDISNPDGSFGGNNIPGGNYTLYVDITGTPLDISMDVTLSNNDNFYFLVVVDSDLIYLDLDSSTVSVLNLTQERSFTVFPNPVTDIINIEFHILQKEKLNIKLYDITGKTYFLSGREYQPGVYKQSLNLSDLKLSRGTYNIVIEGENTFHQNSIVLY